jgi:hypothetical protein
MKRSIPLTQGQINQITKALQVAITLEEMTASNIKNYFELSSKMKFIKKCERNITDWKELLKYLGG